MNKYAKNLRRTRANMLGTDDEKHYWECHAAADEIERLQARVEVLETWCEQTNPDAYEKWKALEATEQGEK